MEASIPRMSKWQVELLNGGNWKVSGLPIDGKVFQGSLLYSVETPQPDCYQSL